MEQEQEQFLIAEVASQPPTPLTEGQEVRLTLLDEQMRIWMEAMNAESEKRKHYEEYLKRTLPGL